MASYTLPVGKRYFAYGLLLYFDFLYDCWCHSHVFPLITALMGVDPYSTIQKQTLI
jgi:hypothetical protein